MPHPKIQSFYSDGSCLDNPGAGGWGLVVCFADGSFAELGGSAAQTTNNRMEMQAAIAALEIIATAEQREPATLYTDSEYVKNGITQWIKGWKKRGWKTAKGAAVLNQDLWQELDRLNTPLVEWKYVRGHSGNEGNEKADAIANGFARGTPPPLHQDWPIHLPDPKSKLSTANVAGLSDRNAPEAVVYKETNSKHSPSHPPLNPKMTETVANSTSTEDFLLPRELRMTQLKGLIEALRIADEIASKGYLISSSELADLMDVNASAVTSRGDHWPWRNWVVSRVRREGNQILWQLERVD